ncbi:MAG: AbrB family transcriptional regulator [Tropicimonas sp.]|uniref:AbrB family transcriptional regulator n=1 Tax=Tropicimonas sp. TaxID=2067044 RepID=UPI003A86368E
MQTFRARILTFALAAAGVAVFLVAGLPLPFLFGPMFACLIAAFSGLTLKGFGQVSVAARTILGVAVGASLTPAVLAELPAISGSVLIIPVYVAVIGLIGVPYFRYVCGYDPVTAYYAAMPGGLQDMVIFGQEAGGNPRTLSLIHATRVLLIVTLVPVLLTQVFGVTLSQPMGAPIADLPWQELAMMLFAAIFGWKAGERVGLFGASILGPMIVAAALSLGGLLHGRPPKEAILVAQFFIGTGIGVYYMGITWREFRDIVIRAIAFVAILAALAAFLAIEVPRITGIGEVEAFLSFAPGGQAEMTVLAIVAGADLGVVIAHHLVRIVLVITCAPIVARALRPRPKS